MPIKPGDEWGAPYSGECTTHESDFDMAQAALRIHEGRRSMDPAELPSFACASSQLGRSMGGSGTERIGYVCDLGVLSIAGQELAFCSSVWIGKPWGRRSHCVLNNAFTMGKRLSLRSHPNDGKLEKFEFDLGRRQRWQFARRLDSGAHLPHPRVKRRFGTDFRLEFSVKPIFVDDQEVDMATKADFRVIPDAFRFVIQPIA